MYANAQTNTNRSDKAMPTLEALQCTSEEKDSYEFDLSVLKSKQHRDADAETARAASNPNFCRLEPKQQSDAEVRDIAPRIR